MGLTCASILYRGNDDENIDETLKETDKTLKEADNLLKELDNEEKIEKNAWWNKPAKEDIFDKIEYWVTGKKPRVRTQGEEVIDAQLTEMAFSNQNAVAELQNELETGARGLASMDRINEVMENSEERPVVVNIGKSNCSSKAVNNNLKVTSNIINKNGLNIDEFNKLRLTNPSELSPKQIETMKAIRDAIPKIDKNTFIQKNYS